MVQTPALFAPVMNFPLTDHNSNEYRALGKIGTVSTPSEKSNLTPGCDWDFNFYFLKQNFKKNNFLKQNF